MSESKPRIGSQEFHEIAPDAYAALIKLSMAIGASGLDLGLVEMVKLRASQINGCAFCTQYHLNAARKHKVPAEKLDLLAVWREAGIFTPREQAALAWTEKLTSIAGNHISDEDYAAVTAQFSTEETAWLTTAIGLINTWNRIAGPLQFTPPIPKPEKELANA
ncbi:carboxymuconolactone decarboxylase family protein [Acidicapsa dinghuensis]|uniref:Carboxymuconolactone decarboxylase family protein n=1 Tax=Acidicapsa dinghuensis TaxID=2218256 RepID=A0ABW1EM27_9BACT|nr:carboxymuconolactone decarboxylase family protein [Acidicapsa dinghuensis]